MTSWLGLRPLSRPRMRRRLLPPVSVSPPPRLPVHRPCSPRSTSCPHSRLVRGMHLPRLAPPLPPGPPLWLSCRRVSSGARLLRRARPRPRLLVPSWAGSSAPSCWPYVPARPRPLPTRWQWPRGPSAGRWFPARCHRGPRLGCRGSPGMTPPSGSWRVAPWRPRRLGIPSQWPRRWLPSTAASRLRSCRSPSSPCRPPSRGWGPCASRRGCSSMSVSSWGCPGGRAPLLLCGTRWVPCIGKLGPRCPASSRPPLCLALSVRCPLLARLGVALPQGMVGVAGGNPLLVRVRALGAPMVGRALRAPTTPLPAGHPRLPATASVSDVGGRRPATAGVHGVGGRSTAAVARLTCSADVCGRGCALPLCPVGLSLLLSGPWRSRCRRTCVASLRCRYAGSGTSPRGSASVGLSALGLPTPAPSLPARPRSRSTVRWGPPRGPLGS